MTKPKEKPVPAPALMPGFAKRRPPSFLCFTCGYRTIDRDAFTKHHAEAHP